MPMENKFTMNKKLHAELALLTMNTAEKGTFDAEDVSVKTLVNFNSYIGCIYLLCKENLIKDKNFELAEEEKKLLKTIHELTENYEKQLNEMDEEDK